MTTSGNFYFLGNLISREKCFPGKGDFPRTFTHFFAVLQGLGGQCWGGGGGGGVCGGGDGDGLCLGAGLLFLVLPYLPASNIGCYVGFVMAERVLYIPR